eukprot:CAMPEP_0172211240 /NCGR_PEP_ID=MMETSP1050-20130122/36287_1 /TAXON_ID=233186 /ORGANISM="Cryptomonas curvata, Strain CCAP979/52" /LENGTH=150 /DNA_ID=CAMNT_0012891659 /DNA_START=174 /DNA_END=623 /DNA_ORIENTATION=-
MPLHVQLTERKFTERQQLRLALSLSVESQTLGCNVQGSNRSGMSHVNVAAEQSPRRRVSIEPVRENKQSENQSDFSPPVSKSIVKDRGSRPKGKRRATFSAPLKVKSVVKKLLDISDRVPFSGVTDSSIKIWLKFDSEARAARSCTDVLR